MASFEDQLAELEKVVEQLERGDLPLEDSVGLFERGMNLSNACKAQLSSAESRIQVLLDPTEVGPVRLKNLSGLGEQDDAEKDDAEDADFEDAEEENEG